MIPYLTNMYAEGFFLFPHSRAKMYRDLPEMILKSSWVTKNPDSFNDVFALPFWQGFDLYEGEELRRHKLDDTFQRINFFKFYMNLASRMMTEYGSPIITRSQLEKILEEYFTADYHGENLETGDVKRRVEAFVNAADQRLPLVAKLEEDGYGFIHRSFLEYYSAHQFFSEFARKRPELIKILNSKGLLTSLHSKEMVRFILEIYSGYILDEGIVDFLDLVIKEFPKDEGYAAALAASFVTEDIISSEMKPVLVRIHKTLNRSITAITEPGGDIQVQRKLQKMSIQKERLERMIRHKKMEWILEQE
jgi:hypothetical protein